MRKLVFTGLLLATFLTYSCESPETTGSNSPQQESSEATAMSDEDKEFVQEIAKRNLYDLELSRLAQEKAATDDVKQFARNLETEHQNLQQQLAQFAQQRNVMLPDSIDSDQREELQKLTEKQGFEFDTEYMDKLVSRHRETVDRFENKAENADDPQLRQWAQNTLPTLRDHAQAAENIEATVEQKKEAQQKS